MSLDQILLLIAACLAVNLSPGPSVLFVTSISAAHGFRAGILAELGMATGAFLHVLLAASGIAAVLQTLPIVFSMIQTLGAAYLIYLAIDLIRHRNSADAPKPVTVNGSGWQFYRRGVIVDALNPKIALFFLAFIPQFLSQLENPSMLLSITLGSVFLVSGIIVNGSIAWLVALGAHRSRGKFGRWLECRVPAGLLIYLGVRLLWQEN